MLKIFGLAVKFGGLRSNTAEHHLGRGQNRKQVWHELNSTAEFCVLEMQQAFAFRIHKNNRAAPISIILAVSRYGYVASALHDLPIYSFARTQCARRLHLIMHRTIGLTGYIRPLTLTLVRSSYSPIVR